jgi:hypothetical protein
VALFSTVSGMASPALRAAARFTIVVFLLTGWNGIEAGLQQIHQPSSVHSGAAGITATPRRVRNQQYGRCEQNENRSQKQPFENGPHIHYLVEKANFTLPTSGPRRLAKLPGHSATTTRSSLNQVGPRRLSFRPRPAGGVDLQTRSALRHSSKGTSYSSVNGVPRDQGAG